MALNCQPKRQFQVMNCEVVNIKWSIVSVNVTDAVLCKTRPQKDSVIISSKWCCYINENANLDKFLECFRWRTATSLKFVIQIFYFNKYVKVAINTFTMQLIISRWLRWQNADRWEKPWDKKGLKRKKKLFTKVFSLIKIHANVCFFYRK